jgi:hypothetical protein
MEVHLSDRWKDALERAVRTFAQATAAAMMVELGREGATWSAFLPAASVGAFAGVLALLLAVAKTTAPRQ